MMQGYENTIDANVGEERKTYMKRADNDEYKWIGYKYMIQNKERIQNTSPRPTPNYNVYVAGNNDSVRSHGETSIKTNNAAEIYPKLGAFRNETNRYKLPIRWK